MFILTRIIFTMHFNSEDTPTNDTNYSYKVVELVNQSYEINKKSHHSISYK